MGTLYAPTPRNLRPPIGDQIVDTGGVASYLFQEWMTNLTQLLQSIQAINVSISGSDATAPLQAALNLAFKQGGGVVVLPEGFYTMGSVSIPMGSPPVSIIGQGSSTKLTRNVDLPPGVGMIDISSPLVSLSDFTLDGGRTVPVGMQYNADFSTGINANDPMAPSLTTNTSIWVHGNGATTDYNFQRLGLQHAAGYSILLDATTGDISNIDIIQCWLRNNRPTLFGIGGGPSIYGSWNGGIFAKGDGRAASGSQSGMVNNLLVQGCSFKRNTGNCLWSHGFGFEKFHSGFRWIGNYFEDCGLDGMLVDIVSGGSVEGNVFRRIGYVTTTDTDQSTPRWLVGLNATAIDSGAVKNVPYTGNSITSCNGGSIDADTHGQGSITGNVCRIPFPDEPEYIEDQIAITGPTNSGNGSYGINMGHNYPVVEGAQNVVMVGNSLINLPAGAIRLYSAQGCQVTANLIVAPDNSTFAPIQMGPQGPLPYQRCMNNRITNNQFKYSPAAPSTPCVLEDDSIAAFDPSEQNFVFNNNPIVGNGNALEFKKSPTSGSIVYAPTVWFP